MKSNYALLLLFIGIILGRESQYVFDLEISGNQKLEVSQLKNKIRLQSRGFFSKTEFNLKKLHLDEITLKNYYQTMGFTDVIVTSTYEVFQETDINVKFNINEGEQYFISHIDYDGIKLFQDHEIDKIIDLNNDDIYNPAKFRRHIKKLKYKYLQLGKLNISIVEEIIFDDNNVTIKLLVSEGATYFIRNIKIEGLLNVDKKYISRELLFKKGMIYDIKIINKTREQIFESKLFSSVEIQSQIIDDSKVDIIIKIREYKSREVSTEIGFSRSPYTKGGLLVSTLSGKLQWKVAQLFNTASAITFNSDIGMKYENGELIITQDYDIYYTSPWLVNYRIPINFKIYYEDKGLDNNLNRLGVNSSFKYFDSNNTQLNGILSVGFISSDILEEAEDRSIIFFLSKHSIINRISPKNGYLMAVSPSIHGSILGGDIHYLKIDSEFKYFTTFLNKITFANRVNLGWLYEFSIFMNEDTEIPEDDKFLLGGQASLRGWSSLEDFKSESSFDGTNRLLLNSEIRFPLYSLLGMELFFDIASFVEDTEIIAYNWDVGYGVTINTGLGPVRVDAAYKRALGKPTILFSLLYMF